MASSLTSRLVALDLVAAVLRRRRPFDEAFEQHPKLDALSERDRGFVRLTVTTVLRRLGQIDALIDHCLERPLPHKAVMVRDVLRLGVAQMIFMGTPAHAAVDTTVDLAKAQKLTAHKAMVNAVMRRLDREGRALAEAQDAARLNTPSWLWESWCRTYSEETSRAIAEAQVLEAPLDITVKADPALWAERLEAEILPTGSLRRRQGGFVPALPGFDEGAWWVQDAAAALPARLLGPVAGKRVADLCAAPGGKTAQLAAAGGIVTAVDRSAKRLERVTANLARLGLSAEMIAADAATWRPDQPFDAILLDAPCSATGTIRRNPDVAHIKTAQDVAKLAQTQAALLRASFEQLRPGGVLVYCVCSMQPEEGVERIAALLAEGAPLRRLPIRPEEVGGLAEILTPDGELRSLPCHLADQGGMDAFFAARLERL
ncbi:16S rRNA (cytosine(967)-C(5))-methyltransferase RsmB [Telmatospirillum sp. J64-1]|uniref:16S rRNA (cytosine(967)-C(5))-methyltransferase RsmB n=1 Tax=Telmatospirillum sp. J64-1 TaxID=2502183 RepID=UPI00115F2539|nr:16S rRNA (cytosine(967)-C(5))-methyltransferase RsmB [Telmatospirillum sp. J64-1]